jgi:aspartate ammonia-lyase
VFREKCVQEITVDEKRCLHYLERNPALATFLSPFIGHLEASKIAQQALREGRSVKEVALEKSQLKPDLVERIFSSAYMLGIDKPRFEKSDKKENS